MAEKTKNKVQSAPIMDPAVLELRASAIFDAYPAEAEAYFTNDGTAFISKNSAEIHALQIGNPNIITIKCKED